MKFNRILNFAACTSNGIVTIFELQSGTNVHTLKHHIGDVLSCCWSPLEEHILCTGGADNRVLLWDIRSSKSFLMSLNRCNTIQTTIENQMVNHFTAHTGSVNSVKFVKNGLKILSCGTDNIIRLWNSMTGKNELVDYDEFTNNSKRSLHVDVTRNITPEFVFVPSGSTINVYNVDSGEIVNRLRAHYNNVSCCFYESYQHELYSGCTDGFIFSWTYDENNDLKSENSRRRALLL